MVPSAARPLQAEPPRWVRDLVPAWQDGASSPTVHAIRSGSLVWLTTTIPGAGTLPREELRTSVARAYADIGRTLASCRASALRLWNYLPNPNQPMEPGLDRYMVFNAGRHAGYTAWLDAGSFDRSLPTATAVGVTGGDLVVHCLASESPGRAVHNPRQRPPWRYSSRYGPLPPAFARGTVARIGGRRALLIGGTASIVGEDSRHAGDPVAQLDETIRNLVTVIAEAAGAGESAQPTLARLTDVRVYVPQEGHAPAIAAALRERCGRGTPIETTLARLCRPELLVEIEGVAELPDAPEMP